jgi:hypothetical protein
MNNILGNILDNIKNLDIFLHDICYSKCLIILLLIHLLTKIILNNNSYSEDISNILSFIYNNEIESPNQIFENIKYDITDLIYDYTYIREEDMEGTGVGTESDEDGEGRPPKKSRAEPVSNERICNNNVDFALIIINHDVLEYFKTVWNTYQVRRRHNFVQHVTHFIEEKKQTLFEKLRQITTYTDDYITDILDGYYEMSQDKKNSLYSIETFYDVNTKLFNFKGNPILVETVDINYFNSVYSNNNIKTLTKSNTKLKDISLRILISELNNNLKNVEKKLASMKQILNGPSRNDTRSSGKSKPSINYSKRSVRSVKPYDDISGSKIINQQKKINKKTIGIIIEFDRAINLYNKYNFNINERFDICIKIKDIIKGYSENFLQISSLQEELTELYGNLKREWSRITEHVLRHSPEVLKTSKGGKSLKKITNRKTRKRKNRKSRKHKNKRSKNNKNKRHFKIRSYKL